MKKKTVIYIVSAVFAGVAAGVLVDMFLDHKKHQDNIAFYAHLIPLIEIPEDIGVTKTADMVRAFINAHSEHNIDDEFYSHWGQHDVITEKMVSYAQGRSSEPVHLECSSRGGAMELTLQAMGIKVRNINVTRYDKNFAAHSFLEVYDPESEKWHIQDPGYDIFWKILETGERASVIDIVKLGVDAVEPCHSERECGWGFDNKDAQGDVVNLKAYFGLAMVKDDSIGMRDIYVNEEIFPLDRAVDNPEHGRITYCDYVKKNCRGDIVRYNHKSF